MNGFVNQVVEHKNFGFIKANGKNYFFHRDDFIGHWGDLEEDYNKLGGGLIKVEFVEVESAKGPRAADVRRLDHPNQAV